jgi:hypothetical protein
MEIKIVVFNSLAETYDEMFVEVIDGQVHGLPYYCHPTLPSVNNLLIIISQEKAKNERLKMREHLHSKLDEMLAYTE